MVKSQEIAWQAIPVRSIYALVITRDLLMCKKKQFFYVTGVKTKADIESTISSGQGDGVK